MFTSTSITSQKSKTAYPKIMKSKTNGLLVLMTSENVGVVISSPNEYEPLGKNHSSWSPDAFEDYNGKVTLENS